MQLRGFFLGKEDVFYTGFLHYVEDFQRFLLYVVKKVYFCLGKRGV
jgi:hypothetical protein